MAKKIKFPLEMKNGVQVRTIEELKENFDIEKAIEYLLDGKLQTWLMDRYYIQEAEEIGKLDVYAEDTKNKLYMILGIENQQLDIEEVDVAAIEKRKEKLLKLKQYTDDETIWEKIDQVAFDQEEMKKILDKGFDEIYLCGEDFTISLAIHNVKYIGVKKFNVILDGEGGTQYCREHGILIENLKYERNGLEEGEEKYINYELQDALELLIPEADSGMGRAMWILYMIYSDGGCGIESDYQKAKKWCLKGKEVGDPLASLYVGLFFSENMDEKKQICREIKPRLWKMADEGDVLAQHALAISYINETDEPVDYVKAVEYLQKSSEGGYWRSDNSLGLRYKNGQGVEKNEKKAFEYIKKSADAGYVHSLYRLGEMYEKGEGIDKDVKKADKCYRKASKQYSESMKKQWKDELIRKIQEVPQYTCNSMLYYAKRETGCDYYNLGIDDSYSTEAACRAAGEAKINSCIQWLQESWSLSYSYSDEKRKRLADICDQYHNVIANIYRSFLEKFKKINGKSVPVSIQDEIENDIPDVSEVIEDVVRDGNYSYYSSFEAVNSIECMDMEINDAYIFRQAKWQIRGWKDRSLKSQEDEKCSEFSEDLYLRIKKEMLEPFQNLFDRVLC